MSIIKLSFLFEGSKVSQTLVDPKSSKDAANRFISSIFDITDTNIEGVCKTFFERPLSGIMDNYELNIITDCMIAAYDEGSNPTKPYFFLQVGSPQRFKQKQFWGKTDGSGRPPTRPNADGQHLYGCYVIEKNWHFTTLLGSDYCVSPQFDSTHKADLLQIGSSARRTVLGRTV